MRALGASRTSVATGGILGANWARNPLWKTARAVPSLDLRFADNKTLGDAVGGGSLVTFTRASTGTYVGSDGLLKTATTNEPRFDHNPTTGESLGLLAEEARTNLALRSEEFNDASWAKVAATVSANAETSPSGALLADKLIVNNGQAAGYVSQTTAFASGTSYTTSCYAKAGEVSDFRLVFESGAFGSNLNAVFNLTTGVISSFTAVSASIQALGNGWYRCTATATATATASAGVQFRSAHAGNGTNGIFLWGAQLEAGAFPTSYIPTTTATVTRAADVASITGSNFSSWYNQTEGTVFVEGINPTVSTTAFAVSDGSTNNRLQMDTGTNTRVARVVSGGTTQASNSVAYTYGASQKFAISYATDLINFANAGTLGTEDTSATIPTVDQVRIGANPTGANPLNSTINRLVYWGQRLPNNVLQAITQ